MKGQMKNLLPLLFFLQISKSITIYKILVPAEIVIYIEEIRKFTDFESIDPNFLMKHFFDFDLKGYISSTKVQMTKASEMSGLKTGSILENLRIPIFIACFALMVLLLAVLAMVTIRPLRLKIKTILIEKKQEFMWNNTILSLNVAYMSLVLTMYAKFIEMRIEI